ncbi:hypothetical protein HZC21_06440 [Candidatus Peregrinibacteria bacterium]|nr:hypothetical protein [Candidatus Peregrinibacteria bacterium]
MQEELPGYDTTYRHGKNPAVDAAVDKLNEILGTNRGGIACLDEKGQRVSGYTDRVVLEMPDDTPEEVATAARAAALQVLQAMHQKE